MRHSLKHKCRCRERYLDWKKIKNIDLHGENISIKDINYSKLILITYVTIDNATGIGLFLNYTF